jgi:hypothetical protein
MTQGGTGVIAASGGRVPEAEQPSFGTNRRRLPIEGKCGHRRRRRRGEAAAWRASLMRSAQQLLGIVYAPDERSAEAAAVAEFKIGEEQRRRLIVRPNDD